MMKPPKISCQQSIVLTLPTGEKNRWGEAKPAEPITITHCVVQPQTIYSGSNNGRTIVANAVIFIYAGVSSPVPKITKNDVGATILFEDVEYTLQKIVDNRAPFSNALYSYELEVL
ncbi:putative minor capsid protein [Lactiplantibacillus mudanjiangensis]|uniref:Capsid protein [Lactobacillus plantarum subsp. plantarum] n=1 Tax=Lactiplantibacillus mudanjiangensis TaxID=1296538 RepID=A0A660E1F7_9LACO|nr:putative minor capsid protein [Lactiplantibacillus mudanjiangensis]VDG26350.1 capsid protein [Lactobacillus plantarum subsp. plantarum] [Lactiplantibacillus mudanjiangensis]VDG27874.1 capsid protein [Lactobacillus plantarum subsp. plantarum] [Lactiplantibacillus mudanjiangensis]